MIFPDIGPHTLDGDPDYRPPTTFPIGPQFSKYAGNPILKPNPNNEFEEAYIYNAAAIVLGGRVFLLYRAQNKQLVLSVGLAWLDDGFHFKRWPEPILYPTEPWEMGGGCEDPRIVRDPESRKFIVTYTAYDRRLARLCVAESTDLLTWKKHPPVIPQDRWAEACVSLKGEPFVRHGWLKSGAIFVDRHKDGKYYMIWGESGFQLAVSDDLVHWTIRTQVYARGILDWQDRLIEPGPAPIKIDTGGKHNHYVLFYNSSTVGSGMYEKGTYTISQMLIDYDNLQDGPLARMDRPVLVPEEKNEVVGQVNRVVFTEGVVQFKGRWFLYFGAGDSELSVATCSV
ncbi:Arabinanase/levansucrase/invertase [Metschnikowia bicuspidata var. bicuspidata NRRL YB-4993]|uniref:Arabinanase/levansucrase/invertase n=1 Tax=Metschnikowia bicuspidata var. bicuspidata NRRL YB-4993 TaxID=869754 RepID=A0A1A0H858_9ASCO|nr:Arabinanase/levansucrase/invertase [Metschnikowia bicuspidata var. bicuspidata NRRL YB-4993]OBA20206.1 Arabinanase/levansucrase/invertase [Metschnikowia bicuspidata var. bicuspidata NRRL YB-4993]